MIKANFAGNDFILMPYQDLSKDTIIHLSNRRLGVGCDQIIMYDKSGDEYKINIFNSDGSIAGNCCNGLRCLVKLLHLNTNKNHFKFILKDTEVEGYVKNDLFYVEVNNIELRNELVYLGNLHKVVQIQDIKDVDFNFVSHEYNMNNVIVKNRDCLQVFTIERGAGYTQSCGSGNIASFFYMHRMGLVNNSIKIENGEFVSYLSINDNSIMLGSDCSIVAKIELL